MGRTKALVDVGGIPMAARVASALRGAGCSPVIACGGDVDELAVLGLMVVTDRFPGEGPLGGIIEALRFCSTSEDPGDTDVLIAPCDLPFLESTDLAAMVAAARTHPGADVLVAATTQREPGCALWRTSALAQIEARFDAGERAIHRMLDHLAVVEVSFAARALRNINTLDDLGRYS